MRRVAPASGVERKGIDVEGEEGGVVSVGGVEARRVEVRAAAAVAADVVDPPPPPPRRRRRVCCNCEVGRDIIIFYCNERSGC